MHTASNYDELPKRNAEPNAPAMISTLRAIGYNPETAVADLIDNSISAGAKNVWVKLTWAGGESSMSLTDDGTGMTEEEIIDALRPGSKDPEQPRAASDLGRFGLGLKTATFSQCRRLTVISKKINTSASWWTWDLDFVRASGKWEVIQDLSRQDLVNGLADKGKGTIILWEKPDKLVAPETNSADRIAHDVFLRTGENIRKHIGMVFHRYIDNRKITIWFNGRKVSAWNPFMPGKPGTQIFATERLLNGQVEIKGYVLPHKSKISEDEYNDGEGPKGWNEQQGFYIYRNERLLVAGDWLGIFRKDEHYKLARILVDISNVSDSEWHIDIKKSVAKPPHGILTDLKNYALKVRTAAVEVYRHKGRLIQRRHGHEEFKPVWLERKRHGKYHYVINREHILVRKLLDNAAGTPKDLDFLLKLLEETVPVPLMVVREREDPDNLSRPFEGVDHTPIRNLMKAAYDKFISEGRSDEDAKALTLLIDPFNQYPEYLESLNT